MTKTGPLPEHAFSAIAITPVGLKGHGSVLIERAAVLAIQHVEADPRDGTAAFAQSLATGLFRLAGFKIGEQQVLNRPWVPAPQGEGAVSREHQLLGRDCHLLHGNQGPAAAVVGPTATQGHCSGSDEGDCLPMPRGMAGIRGMALAGEHYCATFYSLSIMAS